MTVEKLYKFKESRFTSLSHELRVYIAGADVTPWLKGDLSITYGNRDSFNNCTFELSNPRKLWQVSRANIEGTWRHSSGEYCETEKLKVFRWKNAPGINPSFNLNINTVILGQKDEQTGSITQPGPLTLRPTSPGTERRYRLAVNDCVFSRNDPMRIFMRNPYEISRPTGEWVEIFCGYVHDHPITTNYQTGESTLRISGYCVRQLLTKMRVQINRLVTQADPQPLFSRSFFSDFIAPAIGKHPFATSTLERTIKSLILGTETPKTGEPSKVMNGLGDFKLGNVICYSPVTPGNTLERWHLMTLFGVNKIPFPTGAYDDLWLTTAEMEKIGKITVDIPETFAQGPGGRYLHFLLPAGGTGAGALIQSSLDAQAPRTIEWTTRWEIIREFAGKLDFQVTTSPSGDILVEFPLYGFTPHVFSTAPTGAVSQPTATFADDRAAAQAGSSGFTPEATKAVQAEQAYQAKQKAIAAGYAGDILSETEIVNRDTAARVENDISAGTAPYGLGSLLTFELHQLEDTVNDEAEDFPTILQVDGGFALEQNNPSGGDPAFNNLRAFVYSPVLVSRFGVVSEQMSIPFAGQRSGELSGLTESPIAKRMAKLALIEYMKRLADSSTWDGTVVYRPFLFPNRPVWLKRSARIGLLTSVTNRWTIGKSASTSFAVHMLLSERYDPNADPKTVYRLPTGASNMPIDYQDIWAEDKDSWKGHSASGIVAVVGTKTPPSSDANGGAGAVGSGKPTPQSSIAGKDKSALTNKSLYSDFMYKPFSDAMDAAIKKAEDLGMKIRVTSAFRHAKYQQAMKDDPGKYGVAINKSTGEFVQVSEPWNSTHQYGLGLDIAIDGGRMSDYQQFAQLCGDNIYWGGNYGDYVHFEWSTQPAGKTGLQARAFVETGKLTEDPEYYKKVWKHFDEVEVNPVLASQIATPGSFKEFARNIIGLGPDKRTVSTGTVADTAEACAEKTLTTPGIEQFTTVKGQTV